MSMYQICALQTQHLMKKKLTLILFVLTIAFNLKVSATNGQLDAKNSNYVVIGAFSIPKNAIEFTENAKKQNFKAEFAINPNRNLFYVYVLHTGDKKMAFDEANKLRTGSPFDDTWVYTGLLGEDLELGKGSDINPVTGEKIVRIEANDHNTTSELTASTTILPEKINPEKNNEVKQITETEKSVPAVEPVLVSTVEEVEEGSKKFLFKIFTASNKDIQGDVDLMDLDKTKPKKMASYRGNEPVNVKPANKSGNIALVCEVFGYRKIQTVTNFNEPLATEGITVEENKTIVPFELVRLKKGDYAVMYNVYFYKDAGIMRPESKYEVNSLLDMLKENPKYKIRIHGHTNGNAHGKVVSMGDSKNFFALTADVKEGFGSAKKLSEERAKVIQSYLINQGVDPTRMQIKAWGGKKPVYEEDHTLAQANVRVEIEILED
jgi:outer membrane protein OmpA-like peptidoglycan-associated protein